MHTFTDKYLTHTLIYHRHFNSEEDYKNDELFKKINMSNEHDVYIGKENVFILALGKYESRNSIKIYEPIQKV